MWRNWVGVACLLVCGGSAVRGAPPITAAALVPDGHLILFGSQLGIEVRSLPDLTLQKTLGTALEHVHDLRFSPDGKTLLAAGGVPAEAGAVEVWSWPAAARQFTVTEHRDLVYRVAWAPDGKAWVTASADSQCHVYGLSDQVPVRRYEGHSRGVLAIDYLTDGTSIASVGIDQTVRIWDSQTGKTIRTMDNHVGTINDVSAAREVSTGNMPLLVTVSEDRTVRLWQPTTGRLLRFAKLPTVPRRVIWSLDGKQVMVACSDGRVRRVAVETMQIENTQEALAGNIYEILGDQAERRVVVGGESGYRVLSDE